MTSSNSSPIDVVSPSINATNTSFDDWDYHVTRGPLMKVFISAFLALLIVGIIIGNFLVIVSIAVFEKMRTLSNAPIASLASADLLVAVTVLPVSLQYEMTGEWTLGELTCDLWITLDVFCCTASILNIVVIAVDRYLLITRNVRYEHSTTFPRRRACGLLIAAAWVVSALIASSPLFGWRTGAERADQTTCVISQDYGYTIFSTFGAFWFPLGVIFIVYARIFWFARSRILRIQVSKRHLVADRGASDVGRSYDETTKTGYSKPSSEAKSKRRSTISGDVVGVSSGCESSISVMHKSRVRRMRRSARTLGLIIGGFVICWLPFFVVATVTPFCSWCVVPPSVASLVLWLGYANSLFNPAIYAIWDRSFRRSFKLLCTCNIHT